MRVEDMRAIKEIVLWAKMNNKPTQENPPNNIKPFQSSLDKIPFLLLVLVVGILVGIVVFK